MQREQTPVLRYNVAAFVFCAVSMIGFGYWMNERHLAHQADARAEAEQVDAFELRLAELRAAIAKLDAEIAANRGCTLGSYSSDRETPRLDRPDKRELQERYRREQADSALYPSIR